MTNQRFIVNEILFIEEDDICVFCTRLVIVGKRYFRREDREHCLTLKLQRKLFSNCVRKMSSDKTVFSQFLLKSWPLRELLRRFAFDCQGDFVVDADDVNLCNRSVISTRKSQHRTIFS